MVSVFAEIATVLANTFSDPKKNAYISKEHNSNIEVCASLFKGVFF